MKTSDMNIADMNIFDQFFEELKMRNFAKTTVKEYRIVLGYFKEHGVSKKSIQSYYLHIENLTVNTREHYLSKLRVFLKTYFPSLLNELIIPKQPKLLPKHIPSQNQIQEFLKMPDTTTFSGIRDRSILEVFYSTGTRKQELINLKLADIDFMEKTIRINQGKMRKDRILPISSTALSWLEKYINLVRPFQKPQSDFVFIAKSGSHLGLDTPFKIVKKYVKNINCHKLRHAFATHLLQNGMKISSVQKLLGHAQLTMTQRYTQVVLI